MTTQGLDFAIHTRDTIVTIRVDLRAVRKSEAEAILRVEGEEIAAWNVMT